MKRRMNMIRTTDTSIEKRVKEGKIIDFATLAAWYVENSQVKEHGNEWTAERVFSRKQKELKFLSL